MIPGKICTSFAEFQGIVGVDDFRLPLGFQELCKLSEFLVKFWFCTDMRGSIGWLGPAPTTAYRWIVSRFAIVTENLVIPYAVSWIHQLPEYTQVLFLLCWIHHSHNSFSIILQGIAGGTGVFNFLRAFLMVSLNLCPPGQWNRSLAIFVRYQDGAFHATHLCFSFSLAFLPIVFQISGHKCSGLDVSCFLVNLPPHHIYPSGGFSSNRVNWVKPVDGSDKSWDPSIFQ